MSTNFAELKARVEAAYTKSSREFSLVVAALGSATLSQLAADHFPDKMIRLTGADGVETSSDRAAVIVRGTGVSSLFTGLAVELRFYVVAGDAALRLTGTGAAFRLEKSFPPLAVMVLNSFVYAASPSPQLCLRSHVEGSAKAGLSFDATLDLDKMVPGLSALLKRSRQPLHGTLDVKEGGGSLTRIELDGEVSKQVDLLIAKVEKLTFAIGSEPTYSFIAKGIVPEPFVGLAGTIPFTAQNRPHTLGVRAEIRTFGRAFRFEADLTSTIDAALDELSSLANGVGLGGFLPSGFELESVLELDRFCLDWDFQSTNKLAAVIIGVQSKRSWPLLHLGASNKTLVAENLHLGFEVTDPFGAKSVSAEVRGEIAIGTSGRVVVVASYPDFLVRWYLPEGTTLKLGELISDVIGQGAKVPDLEARSFGLSMGTCAPGILTLESELYGSWPLGDLPMALRSLRFELDHGPTGTRLNVGGLIEVAGVDVLVTADHPGAGMGWKFSGETGRGQAIPIGQLISDLAAKFGTVTLPSSLADLTIENIEVSFDTSTLGFSFACDADFPLDGQTATLSLIIDVEKGASGYQKTFGGTLKAGNLEFALTFQSDPTATAFVGALRRGATPVTIGELIQTFSSDVALPEGFDIELNSVFFAWRKSGSGDTTVSKYLIGIDIAAGDVGVDFSRLPLVGKDFPADASLGIDDLQLVLAPKGFGGDDLTLVEGALPAGITLPKPSSAGDLPAGLSISATLALGTETEVLSAILSSPSSSSVALSAGPSKAPAAAPDKTAATPAAPAGAAAPADTPAAAIAPVDNIHWVKVDKTLGPVHIDSIGASFADGNIGAFLSASVTLAGLTLSLQGLGVTGPMKGFSADKLSFQLDGVGLGYSKPPLEISGSFLRNPSAVGLELGGLVTVKTSKFGLTLLGSFAQQEDLVSAFLFGVLDQPIGGPPFFVVTGLALGFGYNRTLIEPAIEQVATFPLIAAATQTQKTSGAAEILASLGTALPTSRGDMVIAAGVKFTSFKIIESFALLAVAFGNSLTFNLLGISAITVPPKEAAVPGADPLVEFQVAFKATYVVDTGMLDVRAQLTPSSHVLSRDCHVTGGFALCAWFKGEHEGDFVVTLGGYHPSFAVPAHYPTVPRLELSWQISAELAIRGSLYMAITPAFFMVGGSLAATFESGGLRAWFLAEADFLLGWQPFQYSAHMSVHIGGSYTFWLFGTHTITVDVGADLEIWGPEFSGRATIDLYVCSISFSFGAGASQTPKPISWSDFNKSFLPTGKTCSIACASGLVGKRVDGGAEVWVVSASQLRIAFESLVPTKLIKVGKSSEGKSADPVFGIASMAVKKENLDVVTSVTVTDASKKVVTDSFEFRSVRKNMPAGLWGTSLTPSLGGSAIVPNVIGGVEIWPAPPKLANSVKVQTYQAGAGLVVTCAAGPRVDSAPGIQAAGPNALADAKAKLLAASAEKRSALLAALGFSKAKPVDAGYLDNLACAPQVFKSPGPAAAPPGRA